VNRRVTTFIAAFITTAGIVVGEDVAVQTVNGHSVLLRELRAGHFPELPDARQIDARKDSEGNPRYQMLDWPKVAVAEDTIPLTVGHGFGFDFLCPTIADGDELVLDAEIQIPPTNRVVVTKYRYDAHKSGKDAFVIWGFRKDHPEYHIPGTWWIRIRNQGKEVYSHSFQVIEEGAANKSVEPTPTR
jgi:hypothetical protein